MAGPPLVPVCTTCEDMTHRQMPGKVVVFSENDLLEDAPPETGKKGRKKLRRKKADEFICNLNALMNDGGGCICLHVKNPRLLGFFDQSVNPAMIAIIPDDTFFCDNFERHIHDDYHVIFNVKIRRRLLSTVSFNTKLSYDKGLGDPTHRQMRLFFMPETEDDSDDDEESEEAETRSRNYSFCKDVEVKINMCDPKTNTLRKTIIFQESSCIQAKSIPNSFDSLRGEERCESLAKLFFDRNTLSTFLPKYLSAFSQLKHGGSIFLGVSEHKDKTARWTRADERQRDALLTLKKKEFHVWNNDGVYVVAKESPMIETDTGEFRCQGLCLTLEEQNFFEKCIKRMTKEEMCWCPDQFPAGNQHAVGTESTMTDFLSLVKVKFHTVKDDSGQTVPNLVVPEVSVDGSYAGVAFFDNEGPEAYCFSAVNENGTSVLERMPKELWFEKIKKNTDN